MIGVFDSGVGGLTVLKSLLEYLPDYDYIYLGDNGRAPYGNKTKEQVYEYTRQAVDFLFRQGCDLIVVACNTASALALRKIQQSYLPKKYPGKRVLGVVRPMAEAIADLHGIEKVGIIATKATIASHIYHHEMRKLSSSKHVISRSAPLLVSLIESCSMDEAKIEDVLDGYLSPLKKERIQALVLGCTHYPYLQDQICQIMGKGCKVYNSGEIVAKSLKDYLRRHKELGVKKSMKSKVEFYTTGNAEKFKSLGERFLNKRITKIKNVDLK